MLVSYDEVIMPMTQKLCLRYWILGFDLRKTGFECIKLVVTCFVHIGGVQCIFLGKEKNFLKAHDQFRRRHDLSGTSDHSSSNQSSPCLCSSWMVFHEDLIWIVNAHERWVDDEQITQRIFGIYLLVSKDQLGSRRHIMASLVIIILVLLTRVIGFDYPRAN